jgi:ABC-type sugar transport system ATPase subunit
MLGSPPINLLTESQAASLGLPTARTVGVRPEHVWLKADPQGTARALVVEHLGPMTVTLLEIGELRLRASNPPSAGIEQGQRCRIHVDPARVLRWDIAS